MIAVERAREAAFPSVRGDAETHRSHGFSRLGPPGPAIPVTETARSAPSALRAPRAMISAVSSLTAPLGRKQICFNAEQLRF